MLKLSDLKKGEKAKIVDVSSQQIPMKLLEMGCLPGNSVRLIQQAPFQGPIYLEVNGSYLAIRKETNPTTLVICNHCK